MDFCSSADSAGVRYHSNINFTPRINLTAMKTSGNSEIELSRQLDVVALDSAFLGQRPVHRVEKIRCIASTRPLCRWKKVHCALEARFISCDAILHARGMDGGVGGGGGGEGGNQDR